MKDLAFWADWLTQAHPTPRCGHACHPTPLHLPKNQLNQPHDTLLNGFSLAFTPVLKPAALPAGHM